MTRYCNAVLYLVTTPDVKFLFQFFFTLLAPNRKRFYNFLPKIIFRKRTFVFLSYIQTLSYEELHIVWKTWVDSMFCCNYTYVLTRRIWIMPYMLWFYAFFLSSQNTYQKVVFNKTLKNPHSLFVALELLKDITELF